jgi:hypothetical protein
MARLKALMIEIGAALSQLLHLVLGGLLHVAIDDMPMPDRDETLSSRVGRAAIAGERWALIAERVIDGLFLLLGDAPGHCRRSIGK